MSRIRFFSSLKWYHFGFSFAWAASIIGSASIGALSESGMVSEFAYLTALIASIALCGWLMRGDCRIPKQAAIPGALMLAIGAASSYASPFAPVSPVLLSVLGSLFMGAGLGCFCVLWQCFYASEGEGRTGILIPLSGIVSISIGCALLFLPNWLAAIGTIGILPLLSAVSLAKCLGEIVPQEELSEQWTLHSLVDVVSKLSAPIACGCIGVFCWELCVQRLAFGPIDPFWSFAFGDGAAAIAATAVLLATRRKVFVGNAYRIAVPIVLFVLLCALVFGGPMEYVSAVALAFLSEFVFLLTQYAIADYSSGARRSAATVFAVAIIPVYAAMWLGFYMGVAVLPIDGYDSFSPQLSLAASCFIMAVSLLFVAKKKHSSYARRFMEKPQDVADAEDDGIAMLGEAFATRAGATPLTARESEVALLAIRGNGVDGISRKLFISENTTRSHLKSIYRKVGVHSRQELVDLAESLREGNGQ